MRVELSEGTMLSSIMLAKLNEQDSPVEGELDVERAIVPVKPSWAAKVTVDTTLVPVVVVSLFGVAEIVKSWTV